MTKKGIISELCNAIDWIDTMADDRTEQDVVDMIEAISGAIKYMSADPDKKFIELTLTDGDNVLLNANHIGHLYQLPEYVEYGKVVKKARTRVGHLTHNNGGFEVLETPQEILDKL